MTIRCSFNSENKSTYIQFSSNEWPGENTSLNERTHPLKTWPHHLSEPLANSLESNLLPYLFFFVLSLSFSSTPKGNKKSQEAEPGRSTEIRRMHAESRLSVLKYFFFKKKQQAEEEILSLPALLSSHGPAVLSPALPHLTSQLPGAALACLYLLQEYGGGKSISNGSHWITAPDEVLMLLFCDWPLP